jgi:hypothetical protein
MLNHDTLGISPDYPGGVDGVARLLHEGLADSVERVKRARKWHLVSALRKAFIRAFLKLRLTRVRSMELIRLVVRTIMELRELAMERYIPLRAGVRHAWRLSMLASSWGHPTADEWRNDTAFIIYNAVTLKLLSRFYGIGVIESI